MTSWAARKVPAVENVTSVTSLLYVKIAAWCHRGGGCVWMRAWKQRQPVSPIISTIHHHRPPRCVRAAGSCRRTADKQTDRPERHKATRCLCSLGTWRQNVQNATRRCISVSVPCLWMTALSLFAAVEAGDTKRPSYYLRRLMWPFIRHHVDVCASAVFSLKRSIFITDWVEVKNWKRDTCV